MNKYSKHISEFTSPQILEIIKWCRTKLNLTAAEVEAQTTKINYEQMEGGKIWLTNVNVNGNIVKPLGIK